jgi:repressor LexA
MNRAKVGGNTIEDGDLILVRQQPVARNGDIIVGMVDGEATVKTMVKAPGYVILKPESKDNSHSPIVVDRDFRVAGTVAHVLKKGFGLLQTVFDEPETD